MMKITFFALIAGLLMLGGCAQELDFQETKRLAEGGDKITFQVGFELETPENLVLDLFVQEHDKKKSISIVKVNFIK